jgi:3-oxoacyl-[acyl-carrier protein] reductase
VNVVVTGGGRGIGRRVSLAFGQAGHRVLVGYRAGRAEAERTVAELRAAGGQADLFQADVSRPDQARALVSRAEELGGPLDGLVNNAGVTRDRPLLKMSDDDWSSVIDANLSGAFYCLRAAAERLARRRDGFILNVASLLAVRGGAGCANYVASKAGLVGLTKAAARDLGRYNVRVNAVLPGFHETEMTRPLLERFGEEIRKEHLLGRLPDGEEFGRFAVFVSGLKSVTGQVFSFESRPH